MRYKIALQKTDEGFAVWVPGLPGCWSQGVSEAEALENIRAAIAEYVEVAAEIPSGAELREIDVPA
jgi:predicted RNase H-like HicB family nuclease